MFMTRQLNAPDVWGAGKAGEVLAKWIEVSQAAAREEAPIPCTPSQLL
jgi:hypothetical protein